MADEIIQDNQIPQAPQGVAPEVHALMQAALTGKAPEVVMDQQQVAAPPANVEPTIASPVNTAPINNEEQIFDADEYLKNTLGFDSWDVAKTEIESLRQKANTSATPSFKFENETTDSIFNLLQSGDIKGVHSILDKQLRIDSLINAEVNKDNAADIIKMGMQLEFKDLTPDEINYKYNKTFAIPREPKEESFATTTDWEEAHNEWKERVADIEMNKIIEAKVLKPKLTAAKSEIKFPQVAQQQVDEGYLQYKKSLEERPQVEAQIREIYSKITPEQVGTKLPFNDEANKIAFEFQYVPDGESFGKSVDMALNVDKFLDTFYTPDGQFDNQKFVSALHFALNKDAYLLEAMKQAKNATLKSQLPDNSQGGLQRQFIQSHEPSELDKQMNFALSPFMKNGNGIRAGAS